MTSQSKSTALRRLATGTLVALSAVAGLSACVPLVVGGAVVGGSMMASDRRTSGAQLEDSSIELKSVSRVQTAIGDRGHVNVTSYNRVVLVTGEVPTDTDRQAVEQALSRIENVRSVVNELAVMPSSSLSTRSADSILSGQVKAAFVDANELQSNAIKVVTERSVVYLMGRVTDKEAAVATERARGVNGVLKVVRVFEIISEAELAELQSRPAPK